MKDTIQIKTELVQFQHDALLDFYKTYPRLIVNKLLLRLCEGCLPLYPPTLANFVFTEPMPSAERRSVVIRIQKAEFPSLWQFYTDLPHGARAYVMVNVFNSYVQHAETDRGVLEKAYWKRLTPEELDVVQRGKAKTNQPTEAGPLGQSSPLTAVPMDTASRIHETDLSARVPVAAKQAEPAAPPDPLASIKIEL